MVGKLVAVVHGESMDLLLLVLQGVYEYLRYVIGVLRGDPLNAREAPFSLDQRQQAAAAVPAQHQVDFPIADPGFLLDDRRPVIHRYSVGNRAFISRSRGGSTRSKAMPEVLI